MCEQLRPKLNNVPYTLNSHILHMIMDTCHWPELLSMYIFYYTSAKEQDSPYVSISDHHLARAMDWDFVKSKKIKNTLIDIGALTPVTDGRMRDHIRVSFDWGEVSQENESKYSCPYGHIIGTSLGSNVDCDKCDAEISCINICAELEGDNELKKRGIYKNTEQDK